MKSPLDYAVLSKQKQTPGYSVILKMQALIALGRTLLVSMGWEKTHSGSWNMGFIMG